MPLIVPNTAPAIVLPPISTAFAPRLQLPNWSPSDFTAAYQFGPRPVDPNELANSLSTAWLRGNQIGQVNREFDALAPQRRLAGDESTLAATGLENGAAQQGIPLAPVAQPSIFSRIGNTLSHTLDGTLGDHANDPKPAFYLPPTVPAVKPASIPYPPSGSTAVVTPAGPVIGGTADLPANPSAPSAVSLTPKTTEPSAFSNASAPDEKGWHDTIATTFGTPKDTANYAQTHSLATGDNGVGAWGDKTTGGEPFVALPPSTLRAYGIDPNTAHGQQVEITANGQTVLATVGDKMPDNSKNGAGIDLNPAAAAGLGITDVDNFKGAVRFRLVSQPAAKGFFASANAPDQGPLSVGFGQVGATPLSLPADANVPTVVPGDTRYTNGKPLVLPAASPAMIAAANAVPVLQSNVLTNAGDVSNAPATSRPFDGRGLPATLPAAPTAGLTPVQRVFASVYGPGAISTQNGHVSYDAVKPLNPLQTQNLQSEIAYRDAEAKTQAARARHLDALPTGGDGDSLGKNDTPEAIQRQISEAGGDASKSLVGGQFDRMAALAELSRAKQKAPGEPLYTPETIDTLAQIALVDPNDPRVKIAGMGTKAVEARAQLANRVAGIMSETGLTGPEAVVAHFGVEAAKSTLKAQEKQRTSIGSFEKTAKDNAQIALDLLDKGAGGSSGIPVLNRWIQAGRQATGDPEVAAFNTAIGAFTNEYAKIISGNTGSGGATDASRREAAELINKGGTPEQMRAQIAIAFQEMENRTKSIDSQIDRLNESIRTAGTPKKKDGEAKVPEGSTAKPATAPLPVSQIAVGQIVTQNGKRYQKQADGSFTPL